MLLAIDIGNSNIVFGVFKNEHWDQVWRIQTDPLKTSDEYEVIFRSLFTSGKVCRNEISNIVISSVVPSLVNDFIEMISKLTGQNPLIISPEIYPKLPLKILNPYQIGSDLVANAIAANQKYESDCMVVDFGTALTFTSISAEGEILGVAIVPGLQTAMKSLAGSTAQLPHVQLEAPPSVLGKNTIHAIQGGIVIGYTGLVEYMIAQTEKTLHRKLITIATGGLASVIANQTAKISHLEKNLTLDGLRIINELCMK